ncbi:hypothetical protein ACLOJK_006161, partial [Asimina triloba]
RKNGRSEQAEEDPAEEDSAEEDLRKIRRKLTADWGHDQTGVAAEGGDRGNGNRDDGSVALPAACDGCEEDNRA